MQKNATPNKNQKALIRKRGLNPDDWLVVKSLNYTMIIKHRVTGRIKLLDRQSF